jgi:uncharacterized protein YjbI with pentapeptide repeats
MRRRFALAVLGLLLATATWAQDAQKPKPCPHPEAWKPADENLATWLQKNKDEDLCNIDLSHAKLTNADLSDAQLTGANFAGAKLNGANLAGAELNFAVFLEADLTGANLDDAELDHANLFGANLNGANLTFAHLADTILSTANLNGANLDSADLTNANLNNANLSGAALVNAHMDGARIAGTNLTNMSYAPLFAPPNPFVAGIKGLSTVTFPPGRETGLVQLRDFLQKAGLRDLEREATFAIERGETKNSLDHWRQNSAGAAEGIFRYVAFDQTTRYGMRPSRALLLIAAIWLLLIPIYAWPIWRTKRPPTASSVYRIWPKDRVEIREHKPTLDSPARIERLHRRGLAAIGWSAYFSLLSAFQIGYREFSVGSWLSRAQPRNFALEATGWVRMVSGIQSLLSVYLLAMWVLTYFGRPFQ